MSAELPEVILTTTSSVDGRISLGRHQRLLDPAVWARWGVIAEPAPFADRQDRLDAGADPRGQRLTRGCRRRRTQLARPVLPDDELYRDHLPHMAQRWFVVADGRGRVDWQYTGDGRRILHVLVCRSTPAGFLQRLRDLEVGYFVVGDERVDLREGLLKLGELGIKRVVADSGGTLNAPLLRQGLVQYIDVVTLPGLVGGAGAPTMFDGPELTADETPVRLVLVGVATDGDAVRTRYRIGG